MPHSETAVTKGRWCGVALWRLWAFGQDLVWRRLDLNWHQVNRIKTSGRVWCVFGRTRGGGGRWTTSGDGLAEHEAEFGPVVALAGSVALLPALPMPKQCFRKRWGQVAL